MLVEIRLKYFCGRYLANISDAKLSVDPDIDSMNPGVPSEPKISPADIILNVATHVALFIPPVLYANRVIMFASPGFIPKNMLGRLLSIADNPIDRAASCDISASSGLGV